MIYENPNTTLLSSGAYYYICNAQGKLSSRYFYDPEKFIGRKRKLRALVKVNGRKMWPSSGGPRRGTPGTPKPGHRDVPVPPPVTRSPSLTRAKTNGVHLVRNEKCAVDRLDNLITKISGKNVKL